MSATEILTAVINKKNLKGVFIKTKTKTFVSRPRLLLSSRTISLRCTYVSYLEPFMEELVSTMMTALTGSIDELVYHDCWRGS